MIKRIINKRIQNLTLLDIDNFIKYKNISLTSEEKNFILKFIKENPTLIYQKLDIILDKISNEASASLYLKLKPSIIEYHEKYKNYL